MSTSEGLNARIRASMIAYIVTRLNTDMSRVATCKWEKTCLTTEPIEGYLTTSEGSFIQMPRAANRHLTPDEGGEF